MMLTQGSYFGFASRMAQKRIYVDKNRLIIPKRGATEVLSFKKPWDPNSKGLNLKIRTLNKRATFTRQPTPIHDYINYKQMSGNEILINLNNSDNLGQQELIGGLLELAKRDDQEKFNWNNNPITAKCIRRYNDKIKGFNAKRTI